MSIIKMKWNSSEKKIARAAFDKAYQREMEELINTIKEMATKLKNLSDVWKLEKYLSERRREIDAKYDYRYSKLILVFSRLMNDNFLFEEDLKGLSKDKIEIIMKLSSNY